MTQQTAQPPVLGFDLEVFKRELYLSRLMAPKIEFISMARTLIVGKDTSSDPDGWSEENPFWGQCAVIACITQEWCGGELVRGKAKLPDGRVISHYWNRWQGGSLDLTRDQFPKGTTFEEVGAPKGYKTVRDYVLAPQHAATRARYARVKKRFYDLVKFPARPDVVYDGTKAFELHIGLGA